MPTAYYHAAPEAALGAVMALYAREETGHGQLVDVSMQECQLQSLLSFPGQCALSGKVQKRPGPRIGRTREIWRTKDGFVTFGLRGGPTRIANLKAMVEYMSETNEVPDWLREYDWTVYNHNTLSDQQIANLEEAFAKFFATHTMGELYREALERRILLAPCNNAQEILDHPQLRSRELFTEISYPELGASIEHPAFFAKSNRCKIGIRHGAPKLGQHNEALLCGELGLKESELHDLRQRGVV